MKIITAANYEGRLHLGYGEENSIPQCLGTSINTYHNFITKFFTQLFGFSMTLEIDGKQRCVNKKSLIKHFGSIGCEDANVTRIKAIGYYRFIEEISGKITITLRKDKLGESFSHSKRMELFEKMVAELQANNTQAVQRLIRKGAYIDREFFIPADGSIDGRSFWSNRPKLERVMFDHWNDYFYSYTPLAMAAEKGNQVLANFILNAKGDNFSSDRKQTFYLSITSSAKGGSWSIEQKKEKTQEVILSPEGNFKQVSLREIVEE